MSRKKTNSSDSTSDVSKCDPLTKLSIVHINLNYKLLLLLIYIFFWNFFLLFYWFYTFPSFIFFQAKITFNSTVGLKPNLPSNSWRTFAILKRTCSNEKVISQTLSSCSSNYSTIWVLLSIWHVNAIYKHGLLTITFASPRFGVVWA